MEYLYEMGMIFCHPHSFYIYNKEWKKKFTYLCNYIETGMDSKNVSNN